MGSGRRSSRIRACGTLNDHPYLFEYISKCFHNSYAQYVSAEFVICIAERGGGRARVCLVPRGIAPSVETLANQLTVVSAGLVVGWIGKGLEFIPSTHLFNLAKDRGFGFGCAVVAKPQGVKAFLYGNDLLLASVERFLNPVERGMYVAVLDQGDLRAIGVGRLAIDPRDFDRLVAEGKTLAVVVENVFDLGVLLRNESYV